ncbi:MAG TPA: hypothetical protein VI197_28265 [Polyangiaceae bacterium]
MGLAASSDLDDWLDGYVDDVSEPRPDALELLGMRSSSSWLRSWPSCVLSSSSSSILWNGCDWCDEAWSLDDPDHMRELLAKHVSQKRERL